MSYVLGKRSLKTLEGVHPKLVEVMKKAITDSPYDFTIIQGLRTVADQKALYAQGRTKPGKIVTYCDGVKYPSNHQAKPDGYGHAIDIVIVDKTKKDGFDWDTTSKYKKVADHVLAVAKELGINVKWGGNWSEKKRDDPHFELA